jgi:hypothetical protein
VIDLTVLVRPNILAALKIKTQQNSDATIAGPKYFPSGMKLLNLHREPP